MPTVRTVDSTVYGQTVLGTRGEERGPVASCSPTTEPPAVEQRANLHALPSARPSSPILAGPTDQNPDWHSPPHAVTFVHCGELQTKVDTSRSRRNVIRDGRVAACRRPDPVSRETALGRLGGVRAQPNGRHIR